MGMFDYIDYRGPLPKTGIRQSRLRNAMLLNLSQSKSVRLWESPKYKNQAYEYGCLKITVREDGAMQEPDGSRMYWSGDLRFYGSGAAHRRWEFVATVKDGLVVSIVDGKGVCSDD